jgi:hypothetical protein
MHKQNHYQYRIERTEYEARGKGEARAFVSLRSAGRKKMFDRHDMLSQAHSAVLAVVVDLVNWFPRSRGCARLGTVQRQSRNLLLKMAQGVAPVSFFVVVVLTSDVFCDPTRNRGKCSLALLINFTGDRAAAREHRHDEHRNARNDDPEDEQHERGVRVHHAHLW